MYKIKAKAMGIILAALTLVSGQTIGGRAILTGTWNGEDVDYVEGQILVGLNKSQNRSAVYPVLAQAGLTVVSGFNRLNIALVEIESGADLFAKISVLNGSSHIDFAEPNMVIYTNSPNDPYYEGTTPAEYPHHWSYNNTGQDPPSGTMDADIDADLAWSIETGSNDVLIAVLDSGIPLDSITGELCHPDLDDTNRFFLGPDYSFEPIGGGENDPRVRDERGHGTHVTGTIAAETDNDEGVSGLCWNCRIYTVQVFNADGQGSSNTFASGVIAAVDAGADIINFSGSGRFHTATKERAVQYADSAGILQIYSAGNRGGGGVRYPARYAYVSYDTDHENYPNGYPTVISVAATDHHDHRSSYSSYTPGENYIVVAAPGGYGGSSNADDIFSTMPNYWVTLNDYGVDQDYGYLAGTSMAAPHVSGTAGLIQSANPNLTVADIKQILQLTAEDVNESTLPGFDGKLGHGRINAYQAVLMAQYMADNNITTIITGDVSGELLEGLLYGDVTVVDNTTIPEGATVNVFPGTDIAFENAELYIDGTFIAEGTQSDPITFTGNGGFVSIDIRDQASANFRHCHFTDIGVYSSVDNGEIPSTVNGLCIFEQCTFETGGVPLVIYGVNNRSAVSNCQFSNNWYGILTGSWAEPEITGCTFTGNGVGISTTTYSAPTIRGCSFSGNNNGTGIDVSSSSAPKLWKVEENAWLCSANNNVFTQCNPAIRARHHGYPMLGLYPGNQHFPVLDYYPEDFGVSGWNRFYNNGTDIVNNNAWAVFAIGNNWDAPNPPGLVGCSESEPDNTTGNVVWEPTVYGLVGNNVLYPPPGPYQSALPPGRLAEGEGDFELALALYDDMVNNEQSVAAVYGVARCLWQQDNVTGIIDKMDEYSQLYPGSAIEEQSVSILASYKLYLAGNANLNEALEHIDYLKLNYPTTELEPKLLFEEAQVHEKLQGSAKMMAGAQRQRLPVKAETAYSILAEKYPDTPLGVLAAIMVGEQPRKNTDSSPLPENFILASNYPNPFNPTTTIHYGIPESSDVTLIVYDIIGREIIQLVDSRVPAGDRRVVWNGRDRHGHPVASGLYIYRLVAKSSETKQVFTQSNKMVLMK